MLANFGIGTLARFRPAGILANRLTLTLREHLLVADSAPERRDRVGKSYANPADLIHVNVSSSVPG
jgi:hypothetical protein